jgi:tetratricopeptide (TPR) repeat protein
MQALKAVGQDGGMIDNAMMGEILTGGFEAMFTALPLDSVKETNKDGSFKLDKNGQPKIKTKYSKDIVGALIPHIDDLGNLSNTYLGAAQETQKPEDFANAAKAYASYFDVITSEFAKANNIHLADSTLAEIKFFEGFSNYYAKDYQKAYPALTYALKKGYTANQVNAYATSALANIVQDFLDNKDYASAYNFIDNAISTDANNPALYDMKGFAVELDKGIDAAVPFYQQAINADPNYAQGYYDLGRCLYLQAQNIIDENPNATNAQLKEKIIPIYNQALPLLEKSGQLNADDAAKAQRVIDDIRYKMELMGVE